MRHYTTPELIISIAMSKNFNHKNCNRVENSMILRRRYLKKKTILNVILFIHWNENLAAFLKPFNGALLLMPQAENAKVA